MCGFVERFSDAENWYGDLINWDEFVICNISSHLA